MKKSTDVPGRRINPEFPLWAIEAKTDSFIEQENLPPGVRKPMILAVVQASEWSGVTVFEMKDQASALLDHTALIDHGVPVTVTVTVAACTPASQAK